MRAAALLLALAACAARPAAPEETARSAPYLLVLGTAQDGGLPQLGCDADCCRAARADPARERLVTSLLLVDPRSSSRWLFDASPDLARQVERARGHPPTRTDGVGRPPLFEGVFLSHAHIGHYLGLAELGREAYGAHGQRVFASPRMAEFLRGSGPWSLLVDDGSIELELLEPGRPVRLADDLSVTPFRVPHRDEFSDTLGFVVRGPTRAVAYLPDIDKWQRWELPLADWLAELDLALVDGTFFGAGELPGRDMASIPHPFVAETLALLEGAPADLRARVLFTHLNHSNPLADPDSSAARAVAAAGMGVASEGQQIGL